VQWFDCLKVTVRKSVKNAIQTAHDRISQAVPSTGPEFTDTETSSAPDAPSYYKPSSTEAARLLQKRCPACFGGRMKGRSFAECVIIFFYQIFQSLSYISAAVTSMWQPMVISIIGTCLAPGIAHHFMNPTTSYPRHRWMRWEITSNVPARGHLAFTRKRFRTPPSMIAKILMRPPMVARRKLVESNSTTEGLRLSSVVTISRFFCQY
jgi:hypothetical protein